CDALDGSGSATAPGKSPLATSCSVDPYLGLVLLAKATSSHVSVLSLQKAIAFSVSTTVVLASLILCARVVDGQFDFAYLDSRGLFVSIFASIFAVEAMKWLVEKKVTIQIKGLPDMIGKTFEAILPLLIIILVSVTFHRVVIYL